MGRDRETSVTSVEVQGFVWWITSSVAYVLFLFWAYTPDAVLESQGITYYPSKYWAVALPTWLCVSVVYAYWAYESLNMMATPSAEEQQLLQDSAWRSIQEVGRSSHFSSADKGIPPLVDIPPSIISMVLHGGKSPQEAECIYNFEVAAAEEQRRLEQQQQEDTEQR